MYQCDSVISVILTFNYLELIILLLAALEFIPVYLIETFPPKRYVWLILTGSFEIKFLTICPCSAGMAVCT
jgi:hypothetical protein